MTVTVNAAALKKLQADIKSLQADIKQLGAVRKATATNKTELGKAAKTQNGALATLTGVSRIVEDLAKVAAGGKPSQVLLKSGLIKVVATKKTPAKKPAAKKTPAKKPAAKKTTRKVPAKATTKSESKATGEVKSIKSGSKPTKKAAKSIRDSAKKKV